MSPRFWLLRDRKPEGPFPPEALVALPDFDPGLLVCPEDRAVDDRSNWRPARKFGEVLEAMKVGTVRAPLPVPSPGEAKGRGPLLIVLAILAAMVVLVFLALMRP